MATSEFTSDQKIREFRILFTPALLISAQPCTKSNSEYYSFKSKEQIIDFPPSF